MLSINLPTFTATNFKGYSKNIHQVELNRTPQPCYEGISNIKFPSTFSDLVNVKQSKQDMVYDDDSEYGEDIENSSIISDTLRTDELFDEERDVVDFNYYRYDEDDILPIKQFKNVIAPKYLSIIQKNIYL